MVGFNNGKHHNRKRVMDKFGKEKGREPFYLADMVNYLNTYIGVSGRVNKMASTTSIQLTSLIRVHPHFEYLPARSQSKTGQWKYIGDLNE